MRDDELATILRDDFDACAAQYEKDAFSRAILRRLDARMRVRKGVLGLAGLLGAGIAAAQFTRLLESASLEGLAAQGYQFSSVLTASLIVAAAVVATAVVLQREG